MKISNFHLLVLIILTTVIVPFVQRHASSLENAKS